MDKIVEVIKLNNNSIYKKMKVGAYCRVSSDSNDQVNSFLAQMQYYSDYINSNPNMVFVDLYADEGITGTSIKKRPEFQRMLNDCKQKLLDRILVKSVTRFARNSLECIESIRLMKSYGVDVFFENDNIDTAKMNSEMMLYIKSAFAQSEATSAAKRMRKSVRMRMEEGIYKNGSVAYGYRFDGEKFIVVEDEAKKVREIFDLYLSGYGYDKIVVFMNEKYKDLHLTLIRVKKILENEKYIGDTLCGKSYTPDILPFSKKINRGESDKFYCKNTHEAIVSEEVFYLAEKIRLSKKKQYYNQKSEKSLFHGKIYCKHCGWLYREIKKDNVVYWCCSKKGHLSNECHAPTYSDEEIKNSFIELFNTLKCNNKILVEESLRQVQYLKMKTNLNNPQIQKIDAELLKLNERSNMFAQLYAKNLLNSETYLNNKNMLQKDIDELKSKRTAMTKDVDDDIEGCLYSIDKIIKENPFLTTFNSELFNKLVEKIFIEQNGDITYIIIGGIELTLEKEENECNLGA